MVNLLASASHRTSPSCVNNATSSPSRTMLTCFDGCVSWPSATSAATAATASPKKTPLSCRVSLSYCSCRCTPPLCPIASAPTRITATATLKLSTTRAVIVRRGRTTLSSCLSISRHTCPCSGRGRPSRPTIVKELELFVTSHDCRVTNSCETRVRDEHESTAALQRVTEAVAPTGRT